jgi:hypothetical protein
LNQAVITSASLPGREIESTLGQEIATIAIILRFAVDNPLNTKIDNTALKTGNLAVARVFRSGVRGGIRLEGTRSSPR